MLNKDDEGRQRLMALEYCLHAKVDVGSPQRMTSERCAQDKKDTCIPILTSAKQYEDYEQYDHSIYDDVYPLFVGQGRCGKGKAEYR